MVCIWIELTQVFTESILILEPHREAPGVLFVSLLNSSVTMSLSIVEKTYPVKLAPNLFSFSSINLCLLSSKVVSSRIRMLHNVHNLDGIMQKTHRVISFQLGDVARYPIL